MSPKGKTYTAQFTHVRRKGELSIFVNVQVTDASPFSWDTTLELKRNDLRTNYKKLGDAMERFVHLGTHANVAEEFLRAAWQRTARDRLVAMSECFEKRNVEKVEKPPEPELF